MTCKKMFFCTCILTAWITRAPLGFAAGAQAERFVQDRFCISFWVDPPADENMEAHYRRIADANFTVVMGGFGARTPEQIDRQLALCEKYGLKAIVAGGTQPAGELPTAPACWGYKLKDEPNVDEFAQLAAYVQAIHENRNGKLAYINLYPSHATPKHWSVSTYEDYVSRYLDTVKPDVLCFDRYPVMRPDADERDGYLENLDVIRRHAQRAGIPFWNFFNTMPYGRHFDPTEAQLRWQVYSSLAYGARGVLYFCYWTPVGQEFPKGGAIIATDGRPTRHYHQAKRINACVKNMGPTLMQLTSTAVYRVKPGEQASTILEDTPFKDLTDGDYLIGVFKHVDGRTAVLLNNHRFAYTAWPTVQFRVDPAHVREVNQHTGKEVALRDDSPAMDGLQLSLDAGQGRLFLVAAP